MGGKVCVGADAGRKLDALGGGVVVREGGAADAIFQRRWLKLCSRPLHLTAQSESNDINQPVANALSHFVLQYTIIIYCLPGERERIYSSFADPHVQQPSSCSIKHHVPSIDVYAVKNGMSLLLINFKHEIPPVKCLFKRRRQGLFRFIVFSARVFNNDSCVSLAG